MGWGYAFKEKERELGREEVDGAEEAQGEGEHDGAGEENACHNGYDALLEVHVEETRGEGAGPGGPRGD